MQALLLQTDSLHSDQFSRTDPLPGSGITLLQPKCLVLLGWREERAACPSGPWQFGCGHVWMSGREGWFRLRCSDQDRTSHHAAVVPYNIKWFTVTKKLKWSKHWVSPHSKQPCQPYIIAISNWWQGKPFSTENATRYQKQRYWNLTSSLLTTKKKKRKLKQNFHSLNPEEMHADSCLSDKLSHRQTWQTHNCLLHLSSAHTKAALGYKHSPNYLKFIRKYSSLFVHSRVLSF